MRHTLSATLLPNVALFHLQQHFNKCCIVSPIIVLLPMLHCFVYISTLTKCCIVSPTTTVFKWCIVVHSAILHEVLPISEFKIQTAYCNISQVLSVSKFKNLTFTCILSCHFGIHSRLLIVNNLKQLLQSISLVTVYYYGRLSNRSNNSS